MKAIIRGISVAVALLAWVTLTALPASAADGSWTESHTHGTIYFDGGYSSTYFEKPQTQLPNAAKITNTSYQISPYDNGNTAELVKICYQRQYEITDFRCKDVTVTGSSTVSTSDFNDLDPKETFIVTHYLYGGTYFAFGGTAQDTVTVDYQY